RRRIRRVDYGRPDELWGRFISACLAIFHSQRSRVSFLEVDTPEARPRAERLHDPAIIQRHSSRTFGGFADTQQIVARLGWIQETGQAHTLATLLCFEAGFPARCSDYLR